MFDDQNHADLHDDSRYSLLLGLQLKAELKNL